jgi:hypothetical protein
MRVLFDQATPLPIRPYLLGHEIRTAVQEGWQTLKNGDLLAAAENGWLRPAADDRQEHPLPARPIRTENRDCGTGPAAMATTSAPRSARRGSCESGAAWQLYRSRGACGAATPRRERGS